MLKQTGWIFIRAAAPAILGALGAVMATAAPLFHNAFCAGAI